MAVVGGRGSRVNGVEFENRNDYQYVRGLQADGRG